MSFTNIFHDQLGREIEISFPPQRIISIVPSQTELLFDLGLDKEVVGITKFCIHPENKFKEKTKIGGTKNLNIKKIHALHPDLIIANKEENDALQVQELMMQFPVWVSDIKTLKDAFEMMLTVGAIVGRKEKAAEIVNRVKASFSNTVNKSELPDWNSETQISNFKSQTSDKNPSAAYIIWRDPYMTVGSDTFISSMLEVAGFRNVFDDQLRYPEISIDDLAKKSPQYVLLSSEPFPFKQKHVEELQELLPDSKMQLVDGEMFSWYGSRLLKSSAYFSILRELL